MQTLVRKEMFFYVPDRRAALGAHMSLSRTVRKNENL